MATYTTLGLTDGDLSLKSGTIAIKTDINALADKINCALSTIKGESDDPNVGVDYYNIVLSNTPLQMKVKELSRVILLTNGVTGCTFVDFVNDKVKGVWTFRFSIDTVFGQLELDKTVEKSMI